MRIEELSIGDWVSYDKCSDPVRILGIDSRYGKCVVMTDSYYPSGVIGFIENVHPIPLTPEILEKNGFSLCNGCTSRWELECGACWIGVTAPEDYADVTIYKKVTHGHRRVMDELQIRGIHQLQHALRLAGIEKDIMV